MPQKARGTPQKLLVPCPTCGCTVLRGIYHSQGPLGSRWETKEPALMPVSGAVHACATAPHAGESKEDAWRPRTS
jgi:hypothetical protein